MINQDPNPRGRFEKEKEVAEQLYHNGWYGSPAKRKVASNKYRKNYDRIFRKEKQGDVEQTN